MWRFGTYPGFKTITRIHINVKFQAFTRFFGKVTEKKLENKNILFFYGILTAFRNQNISVILFLQSRFN